MEPYIVKDPILINHVTSRDANTSPQGSGISFMKFDWDYIIIGSNGFAQVGRPGYWEKQLAEKAILLPFIKANHPVPDKFSAVCFFGWKSFEHEFGTYHELVLHYDRSYIDCLDEDSEEDCITLSEFWSFVNECESENLESEDLEIEIQNYYYEKLTCDNAEKDTGKSGSEPSDSDDFPGRIHMLDLTDAQAAKIRAIHFNVLKPEHFRSVKNWIDQCYHQPSDDELCMCAYNEILEGFGVEGFQGEFEGGYWGDIEFTYVNMGDTYASTIVHHRDKGWLVTTVGDLVESVL